MTENYIQYDQTVIEKLINVLNKIQLFIEKNLESNFANNIDLKILLNLQNKKSKIKNLQTELKHITNKLNHTADELRTKTDFFENLLKYHCNC